MTSGLFSRMRSASPLAMSWIVAAIVLILHGTAPGPLQIPPAFELLDGAPAVSSDERADQRGTLPRAQLRATSIEAGASKPPQRRWNAGGKPYALPPAPPTVTPAPAIAFKPLSAQPARPGVAQRFFDPRGPPLPAA